MAGVNKVIILGRLGADPEVRSFQNGNRVVSLRVATSERWKDKQGETQERTEWHQVSIFNEQLGDIAEKYLRKGAEVYLEGQLETRKWTDKNGVERFTTEVVLRQYRSQLQLIGGRGGNENGGNASEGRRSSGSGSGGQRSGGSTGGGQRGTQRGGWDRGPNDLDDDIPF